VGVGIGACVEHGNLESCGMGRKDEQAGVADRVRAGGSRRLSGGVWMLMVAGALLLYPLSVGPVGYAYGRADLGAPRQVEVGSLVCFRPLVRLGDKVPEVGEVVDWYFQMGYSFGSGRRIGVGCGTRF
jgi:hypothetical protein